MKIYYILSKLIIAILYLGIAPQVTVKGQRYETTERNYVDDYVYKPNTQITTQMLNIQKQLASASRQMTEEYVKWIHNYPHDFSDEEFNKYVKNYLEYSANSLAKSNIKAYDLANYRVFLENLKKDFAKGVADTSARLANENK